MQIPLRILVTDLTSLPSGLTWGDIITNWEAYAKEWQEDDALPTIQQELPILDMFEDETIVLNRLVKDLTDPQKLFTDYSRSFTVPASKKNNVIFKHYYKLEIDNGLDARELIPCKLLLNNEVFQVGNLELESIDMRDGKAYSYNIRFLGNLTELQKKMGETKLASLNHASIFGFDQKARFSNTALQDVVFPLSSRETRFLWGASETQFSNREKTRTINYLSSATTNSDSYGIHNTDLVGAYKVGTILTKIEQEFGFTFNGVLDNNYITELYLWLNNNKLADESGAYNAITSSLSPTSSSFTGVFINGGAVNVSYAPSTYYVSARGTFTGNTTLTLLKDGVDVATQTVSGQYTSEIAVNAYSNFTVRIDTDTVNSSLPVEIKIRDFSGSESFTENLNVTSVEDYFTKDYIPEVTVLDFLKEVFRMFNIVAIVNDDLSIDTYHYDAYMALGGTKDISDYVNVDYTLKTPNYYRGVEFKYKYKGTAIEEGYKSTAGREYGSLTYDATGASSNFVKGQVYKIDMKSALIPVEHIVNGTSLTNTVHAYFGDVSLNKKDVGLSFTYVQKDQNQALAYYDGSTMSSVSQYLMPTAFHNAVYNDPSLVKTFSCGLFWGSELRTVYPSTRTSGLGLQNAFYKGVISTLFDEDKRRVEIEALLPLGFLKKLYLGDVLTIRGNFYHLTEISTNYLTGISKLKLLQVGTAKSIHFRKNTASITNNAAATTYITYVDFNGNVSTTSLSASSSVNLNTIGEIIYSSEGDITVSYAAA